MRPCHPLDSYGEKGICVGHAKEPTCPSPWAAHLIDPSPPLPPNDSPIFNLRSPESECLRAVNMVAVISGTCHCPPISGGGTTERARARVWNTDAEHPGSTALHRRQSTPTDQMFQPTPRSTSVAPATRRHTHTSTPLSAVLERLRQPQASSGAKSCRWVAASLVGRAAGHATSGHKATCKVVSREGSCELPALVYRCLARRQAGACCPHAERDGSGFEDFCATFTFSRVFGTQEAPISKARTSRSRRSRHEPQWFPSWPRDSRGAVVHSYEINRD